MIEKRNIYRNIFFLFFLSIIFTFFFFRPLNSEWYRIITADGLGYYSYLPAKFIYNDDNLDFKWFNDLYNQYYKYNSFATPLENFTSEFNGKPINKYYPGMSFLWMPFFLVVHFICKIGGLHANGLSQPYQMAIGFATLIYTCLGLWFLRKFLFKLYKNEFIALVVPILVYYGTNLFSYTIFIGSFSHAYSFTFITIALYYCYCFFKEDENKLRNGLLFILCALIVVFIRPINILFLIAVPAFIKPINIRETIRKFKITPLSLLIISILSLLIVWQFYFLYKQTNSFFPNTYLKEKFYFERGAHIKEILWSYHAGLFLYVPLTLISLFSLFYFRKQKQNIFLYLTLAAVIYLYSNWWYYTIFTRTIVDYTGIFALLLGSLLFYLNKKQRIFKISMVVIILSVFYFQLKAYQLRSNILDNNYTYKEYYWRNFFTIYPINIYPVHPKTVIDKVEYFYDYENIGNPFTSKQNKFEGEKSLLIYTHNYFSDGHNFKMPDFTSTNGFSKIKTSFFIYFTDEMKSLQLVYRFYNRGKELYYFTNYMNSDKIRYNTWEYKEIGCDVPKEITAADSVSIFFWNEWGVNKVYIDNVKHEFFLTDSSMEMVP